nr:energy transducer TonB [uncultured Holophaga sp.]
MHAPHPISLLPTPDLTISDTHRRSRRPVALGGTVLITLGLGGLFAWVANRPVALAPRPKTSAMAIIGLTEPDSGPSAPWSAPAPRTAAPQAPETPPAPQDQVPEETPQTLPTQPAAPQAPAVTGVATGTSGSPNPGPVHPSTSPGRGGGSGAVPPRFDADYLKNPAPRYPARSRRFREEGQVLLRVLVSPEGQALQVELRVSSGFPSLDQEALSTVQQWRFQPARLGQDPVSAWVLVPIVFSLHG